jgi:hypothetical protein
MWRFSFFFTPISQNVVISKLFFFASWKCGDLVFLKTYFSKCGDFKTFFFPLLEMWRFSFFLHTYFSKCGDFKTLFFPLLEMWRFSFFFGNLIYKYKLCVCLSVCVSHDNPESGIATQNGSERLKQQFPTASPNLGVGALKQQFPSVRHERFYIYKIAEGLHPNGVGSLQLLQLTKWSFLAGGAFQYKEK